MNMPSSLASCALALQITVLRPSAEATLDDSRVSSLPFRTTTFLLALDMVGRQEQLLCVLDYSFDCLAARLWPSPPFPLQVSIHVSILQV